MLVGIDAEAANASSRIAFSSATDATVARALVESGGLVERRECLRQVIAPPCSITAPLLRQIGRG